MSEKVIISNKGMVRVKFTFWVGRYIDKFYDGLEQKKIIGNKCPNYLIKIINSKINN